LKFDQTQASVSEALQHNEYLNILVVSLGTGTTIDSAGFDARSVAFWPVQIWTAVALDMLSHASSCLAEFFLASLISGFQTPGFQTPGSTYLRIEVYIFVLFSILINKSRELNSTLIK